LIGGGTRSLAEERGTGADKLEFLAAEGFGNVQTGQEGCGMEGCG